MFVFELKLTVNVFAAIAVAPFVLEVIGILMRTRTHSQNCTAFFDAVLVKVRPFFRDTPADQCTSQSAGQTAGSGTRQSSC